MSKVIKFYANDAAKNPDNVLEQAIGEYGQVLILGWNKDGNFDPRSDTTLTAREILWLVTLFQHKLMSGDYEED